MATTIIFDFDGVIHKYRNGWRDGSIYDEPNMEVVNTILKLIEVGHPVCIVSTREPIQICNWWNNHKFGIEAMPVYNTTFYNKLSFVGVSNTKIAGSVYIDDRAICFNPNTEHKTSEDLLTSILSFIPWQKDS